MKLVFNADMLSKSIDTKGENEIVFEEYFEIQKSEGGNPNDPKFEYFKKKVLDHLAELEKKENGSIAKSIDITECIQKANFPVGTVRTWNGQKFKKITPKKWVRVYESESRGAKLAVAALRRKAAACKSSEELLQLCLENKERFIDGNGKPLGFMQEFSEYVSGLNDKHEGEKTASKQKEKAKGKGSGGGDEPPKDDGYPEKDYPEYRGKGQEAVNFIAKNKGGQVRGAFNRKEIGDIDIVWGEITDKDKHEGYGLAHIVDKHGENALSDIGDVINNGEFSQNSSNGRASIEKDGFKVAIRRSYNGKEKTWVVTGFKKENGTSTIPSSAKNYTAETSPKPSDSTIPQNGGKSSGIESIRSKYQSSKSIEGDEDEIYIGKETISGKWKLVEADAPSASHDEITFHKTKGFPTATDGGTVNDRDYEHDTAAQEAVLDMSADFDGRALGFDSPIVVTQDGVVTSGNNRTMSSKLAARKGTDTKYIEALKKRAKKFGFTADDVAAFRHPRVVFETEHKGNYTTDEFAKYNESGKKAKSPIEKAVEVSKRMKAETIESIAGNISEFDTMGELYADKKASLEIFNTLINSNIIQKTDLSQYYTDGGITETGKEFLETVLVGSVINETNIRALNGAKAVRQKLVRAIVPLVENKGMKGYSINKELNEAVSIAIEVSGEKSKKQPAFRSVEEYSQLRDLFEKQDPVAIELAKKLDGRTQKEFAEFMLEMNGGLRPAANGEVDIFLGGVESKEEIVSRVLKIKDTVKKALDKFFGLFGATA